MFKIKENGVVAWALRLRFLERWPLMRNTRRDNVAEHTFSVSLIAHHIAMIDKHVFKNDAIDPAEVTVYAVYHDLGESSGPGDIPHSVKYSSPLALKLFREMERQAEQDLADSYTDKRFGALMEPYIRQCEVDPRIKDIVKSADIIDAYIHAAKEVEAGNGDFKNAMIRQRQQLTDYCDKVPAVAYFCKDYLAPCLHDLDKLTAGPEL